ncbi:type I methionyl aminopeptidase [Sandarakinorhabdus rubra]|uniref:type I methionyl aminopeptidase n=1 Tax=Sandarakinorhabdus rubra TaxID=2672568 RepID=UPI0013DA3BFB|nr:type I methionyl aminopeptidase [Sandarakinorhabdus rubra]
MTQPLYTTVMDPQEGQLRLHGPAAFEAMRRAGQLAAEVLDHLTPHVLPEVATIDLDTMAWEYVRAAGASSATVFYRGFSHSLCISVNHVVCHGIPGPKKLKSGDIVNIDVTVVVDGWYGDTSRMFLVGDVPLKARRLVEVTHECLMLGIAAAKPGNTLGDVGHAIQTHAEQNRMSVVRDFCGHGLGQDFHTAPNVVHIGRPGRGVVLRPGMFFTIEPMINAGGPAVKLLDDGWTAVTRDRSLSAQFEHSIGITETGAEIFTASPKGWHAPPYL